MNGPCGVDDPLAVVDEDEDVGETVVDVDEDVGEAVERPCVVGFSVVEGCTEQLTLSVYPQIFRTGSKAVSTGHSILTISYSVHTK